jgi:hypothetical protein
MLRIKALLLFFAFLMLVSALAAQGSLKKSGSCTVDSTYLKLDTLSIVPGTFVLEGLDGEDYQVDYLNGGIRILNQQALGKTVSYSYNCFSFDLKNPVQHRSEALNIRQKGSIYHQMTPIVPKTEDFFANNASSLQSTGSISRGVSIGTNQDFVLNSSLNLQLTGKLSDKLEIMANITDKNVPIQPEGNTQSIRDFDKIFIRLDYDHRFWLDAGDIEVEQSDDAFMCLHRKFMGMSFSASNELKGGNNLKNAVGGGVNKGKYVRQVLAVQNGVQGPYRLSGESGEPNITILAGSERVFMDGELLVRGQDNDYIIDYNTGELTFTVKHLMTSEKRVIVEYEYTDRHYARYNLFTFNEFTHEKNQKLKLKLNFYHEQDLKNRSIQPELNNEQKLFLSTLPSNVDMGWFPSADSVYYNQNEVLYERRDTIVNDIHYEIYVYSTNDRNQLYRLNFTMVGAQQGNYILLSSIANGRVFTWVAPVDGVPQGNYEPVILLNTPKTMDMATITAAYDFSKNTGISCELALSNYDLNNFSKDNKYNVGFATKLDFHHQKELKNKRNLLKPWVFQTMLSYEFLHKNFHVIESTREVEFARNYNLTNEYSDLFHEQMVQFSWGFNNADIGNAQYDLNWFSRLGNMHALKNEFNSAIAKQGWKFSTQTAYLFTTDSIQRTDYVKTYNTLSKSLRMIELGVKENFELNAMKEQGSGDWRVGSNGFNEAMFFLKNNDSLPYLYQFSYKNRIESRLNEQVMDIGTISHEAKASFELAKLKNNRIRGDVTYRNMKLRSENQDFNSENYFLAGVEYTGRFWKNSVMLNTYYEAGSGLERKMAFTFLKVADGQGVYTWIDYNGNGIEEIDEFEVAVFQDQANYIKVWQNSNEYVNTFNNQFSQTIQLRPANAWSNKKDFRRVLARFSDAASLKIVQKNTFRHNANAINPFYFNMLDTNVISCGVAFNNTFSYNHKSLFGIDFITQINRNKNLMYYGADLSWYDMQQLLFRVNISKLVTLKLDYSHSTKRNSSEFLVSRCYTINMHRAVEELIFNHKNKLHVNVAYIFTYKKNLTGIQLTYQHRATMELKYKMLKQGNLIMAASYIYIQYNDLENSSLSYEMLEGMGVGHNASWNVKYEANITDFLQVNLLYQGRYAQDHKVVHTGSVELRAHF